jgi:hypothetical protein
VKLEEIRILPRKPAQTEQKTVVEKGKPRPPREPTHKKKNQHRCLDPGPQGRPERPMHARAWNMWLHNSCCLSLYSPPSLLFLLFSLLGPAVERDFLTKFLFVTFLFLQTFLLFCV